MLKTKLSCCSIVVLSGLTIFLDTNFAQGQNRPRLNGRLPDPPVLREPYRNQDAKNNSDCSCPDTNNRKPVSTPTREVRNPTPTTYREGKEYVFQAPGNLPPYNRQNPNPPSNNPQPLTAGEQFYRVLVKSDNPQVLAKIKEIEPLAFVRPGESVIQVGIFQEQRQALGRVKELANKGFNAQVVAFVAERR